MEVVQLLLQHGANIDVPDQESGATPLMVAAAMGRTAVVEELLKRGADPRRRDRAGRAAAARAQEAGFPETEEVLEKALKTTAVVRR